MAALPACSICLDPLGTHGGATTLPCGVHNYCTDCIDQALASNPRCQQCPQCRRDVPAGFHLGVNRELDDLVRSAAARLQPQSEDWLQDWLRMQEREELQMEYLRLRTELLGHHSTHQQALLDLRHGFEDRLDHVRGLLQEARRAAVQQTAATTGDAACTSEAETQLRHILEERLDTARAELQAERAAIAAQQAEMQQLRSGEREACTRLGVEVARLHRAQDRLDAASNRYQEGVAVQEAQAGHIQALTAQLSRALQRLTKETTAREGTEDRLDAARHDLLEGQAARRYAEEALAAQTRSHEAELTRFRTQLQEEMSSRQAAEAEVQIERQCTTVADAARQRVAAIQLCSPEEAPAAQPRIYQAESRRRTSSRPISARQGEDILNASEEDMFDEFAEFDGLLLSDLPDALNLPDLPHQPCSGGQNIQPSKAGKRSRGEPAS